jgi:hypothetical protein
MIDTFTINANGTTDLGYAGRVPRNGRYLGTVFVSGNFGGGTLKLQASADGGTTKFDIPDQSGNVVSFTAQAMRNLELGTGGINLYAVLSGATSPSITVTVADDN